MAKKVMMGGATCNCGPANFIWMIIAAVVLAVGLYVLVMALQTQWSGGTPFVNVAAWYALGFIIVTFGKMAKMKAMCSCPAHGKCC